MRLCNTAHQASRFQELPTNNATCAGYSHKFAAKRDPSNTRTEVGLIVKCMKIFRCL